jgi:hypothetical protein
MYASYYTRGVWEDRKKYFAAESEAGRFFNGEIKAPCHWLKAHNIGQVYWDTEGSPYKFRKAVEKMKFLDKIYQRGNVALYSVGECRSGGEAATGQRQIKDGK